MPFSRARAGDAAPVGPLTGSYRTAVGGTPRSGRSLARADVARAMPAPVDDPAAVKQGVGVAY